MTPEGRVGPPLYVQYITASGLDVNPQVTVSVVKSSATAVCVAGRAGLSVARAVNITHSNKTSHQLQLYVWLVELGYL